MRHRRPVTPRGVDACIDYLTRRRDWVGQRAGGGYDHREWVSLGYALALLEEAKELGLVEQLEQSAIERGTIKPGWVKRPSPQPKGETP